MLASQQVSIHVCRRLSCMSVPTTVRLSVCLSMHLCRYRDGGSAAISCYLADTCWSVRASVQTERWRISCRRMLTASRQVSVHACVQTGRWRINCRHMPIPTTMGQISGCTFLCEQAKRISTRQTNLPNSEMSCSKTLAGELCLP